MKRESGTHEEMCEGAERRMGGLACGVTRKSRGKGDVGEEWGSSCGDGAAATRKQMSGGPRKGMCCAVK